MRVSLCSSNPADSGFGPNLVPLVAGFTSNPAWLDLTHIEMVVGYGLGFVANKDGLQSASIC